MLWNITVNDAGSEYDPLTLLRSRTTFGRPDWKAIYTRMRQAIESGHYLPGATSQLRTEVGVRDCVYVFFYIIMYHISALTDILLRPWWPGQDHQGGLRRLYHVQCKLLLQKGSWFFSFDVYCSLNHAKSRNTSNFFISSSSLCAI